MDEIRILSPTAILGYGFPEVSFAAGLDRRPHLIAVDAGSTARMVTSGTWPASRVGRLSAGSASAMTRSVVDSARAAATSTASEAGSSTTRRVPSPVSLPNRCCCAGRNSPARI